MLTCLCIDAMWICAEEQLLRDLHAQMLELSDDMLDAHLCVLAAHLGVSSNIYGLLP